MEKKFTNRDKFDAIIGYLCHEDGIEIDVQTLVDFCQDNIDRLDARSAKGKAVREAKRAEPDVLLDKVYEALNEAYRSADEITATIDDADVSVAKVRNRLSTLVREGKAEKMKMKVPATEDRKASEVMCYKVI